MLAEALLAANGLILFGLGRWISGMIIGSLAGLIVGFMLGKGVNPVKWVTSAFSSK